MPIAELEAAAAAGWQAPVQERLGGWLLRAADGFTGRANSALPAGEPGMPLAEAVGLVREWYRARGLPAMIAVAYPAGRPGENDLDEVLADHGWTLRRGAATVMTALAGRLADDRSVGGAVLGGPVLGGPVHGSPVHGSPVHGSPVHGSPVPDGAIPGGAGRGGAMPGHAEPGVRIEVAGQPDDDWLGHYHRDGPLPPAARHLLRSAPWQAFGSVRADGETIAIGRVAMAGEWAGLTAISVDPAFRRRGLGTAVTIALANLAAQRGARGIYLQVENDNAAARALYREIGFGDHHGYHYRVEPEPGSGL